MKKLMLVVAAVWMLIWISTHVLYDRFASKTTMVAASAEKEIRLHTLPAPRLIFTGGSAIAFGLDSKKVEDSTGLHVVNMGQMGGLGIDFLLNETLDGLQKGDRVILCTEYYLSEGTPSLLALISMEYPGSQQYIHVGALDGLRIWGLRFQIAVKALFWGMVGKPEDPVYRRSGFNGYGDLVSHVNLSDDYKESLTHLADWHVDRDYSDEIKRLNRFIHDAEAKGASVWYSFQSTSHAVYSKNRDDIEWFGQVMEEGLECPLLDQASSNVFPDSMCFAPNHLDRKGRQVYTDRMIEHIRSRLLTQP